MGNVYIRLLTLFLFRVTASAYGRKVSSLVSKHVHVVNTIQRGGSTGSSTKRSRNVTKQDDSTWLNLFQLQNRRLSGENGTSTKGNVVQPVSDVTQSDESNTHSSPIIQNTVNSNSRNNTGWFQKRQPWRNSTSTKSSTTTNNATNSSNSTATKSKGWRRKKQQSQVNTTTVVAAEKNISTTTTTTADNTIVVVSDMDVQNQTGMILSGPGVSQQQQQQQIYRGQPTIIRSTSGAIAPSTTSTTRSGVATDPTNSVAILLLEFLTLIVGKASYLWFFTWLARRMAQQEEGMILPTQHFVWERLNDRYSRDVTALQTVMREPPLGVSAKRWHRQHVRKVLSNNRWSAAVPTKSLEDTFTRTVVVVELSTSDSSSSSDGNFASGSTINLKSMPDVVSFLIQQQRQRAFGTLKSTGEAVPLEVVFIVNSPGGAATTYGLAAAQMRRLTSQVNITTTVCVDKHAASGGFMIASQANKLIAAPFAIIGSVGVIMEGLNFYELAKRYGVQPLVIKAGESKNPLSQWGPVTRDDLAKEQRHLEKIHEAFKEFVTEGRPGILANSQQVMDGSVYLGSEAKHLGLIDDVMTTDEYIFDRIEAGDRVLRLHRSQQGRLSRQFRISPIDILPHLRTWLSCAIKMFSDVSE
jgi:ATP-dependent protease ClpP protease subunit